MNRRELGRRVLQAEASRSTACGLLPYEIYALRAAVDATRDDVKDLARGLAEETLHEWQRYRDSLGVSSSPPRAP